MDTLKGNILANAAGRLWGILSVYIFIPFYIKLLGLEAYGLVGFYAVMQGVLIIADAGFTATLNRELARLSAIPGKEQECRNLVRTIELIYWVLAALVGGGLHLILDSTLVHWVNPGNLPPAQVRQMLSLMIVAVVVQLPGSLYLGGLLGLERQTLANGVVVSWSLLRNLGVILALVLVSNTLETFFIWQIFSNLAYSVGSAYLLWRRMPPAEPGSSTEFSLAHVVATGRYAAGMALMSVFTVLSVQLDKILVARYISLDVFACYALANALSQVPVLVAGPIAVAVFPRLTALVARSLREETEVVYHRACQLVAVVAIPAGVLIGLFARDLVMVWTQSARIADTAAPMVIWFVVGFVIQALVHIPYRLALAHSYLRLNLLLSLATLLLVAPIMIFLVDRFGAIGGAIAWTILNVLQWFPLVLLLHRRFLPGADRGYFLVDTGIPLGVALFVGGLAKVLIPAGLTRVPLLGALALAGCGAVAAAVLATPGLLRYLRAERKGPTTA